MASSVFGKVSSQVAGRRGFERRPIPLMPPVAAGSWAVLVRIFLPWWVSSVMEPPPMRASRDRRPRARARVEKRMPKPKPLVC